VIEYGTNRSKRFERLKPLERFEPRPLAGSRFVRRNVDLSSWRKNNPD